MARDEFIASAKGRPAAKAPYTMVEAGDRILSSPIDDLDLSRPVENALSGSLTLEWQSKTPLLVGGGNSLDDCPSDGQPLKIDDQYALPGSTLKGLVRSTMEIAAFARLSFVEDHTGHTHSYDDLTWQSEVKWRFGRDRHQGGWLFRTPGGYRLVKAQTEPLAITDLVALLPNFDVQDWHQASMQARQELLDNNQLQGLVPATQFNRAEDDLVQLVVAGQTADADWMPQKTANPKLSEHLFFWPERPEPVQIDKRTGDRFVASLHKDPRSSAVSADERASYSVLITTGGVSEFEAKEPEDWEVQCRTPEGRSGMVF